MEWYAEIHENQSSHFSFPLFFPNQIADLCFLQLSFDNNDFLNWPVDAHYIFFKEN